MKMLGSFKGKSLHTINDTGRVSIPSKFREILKTKYDREILILVSLGSHIVAYPELEWQKLEEAWDKEPPKDPEVKKFIKYIYSTAEDCSIDKLGRILIPPILREKTNLKTDCVIIGVRNKIEIWSKERWEEEFENISVEDIFTKISEQFPEINL